MLVDSCAWIALVRSNDQHHAEADQLFRRAIGERVELVTTNLIVAEVHRFLLFHIGILPAAIFLDRIDASPLLAMHFVSAPEHQRARDWLSKLDDQKISYTDATSFAVMEEHPCSAVMTFDADFLIAGFQRWQTPEYPA